MTKKEVFEVVHGEVLAYCDASLASHVTAKIVDALLKNFILLNQGYKANYPPVEKSPGGDCARCHTRGGFGAMVAVTDGVSLCGACLEELRREGAEARSFWERIAFAYSEGAGRSGVIGTAGCEYADMFLAEWMKRWIGEKPRDLPRRND